MFDESRIDWTQIGHDLAEAGCAVTEPFLQPQTCELMRSYYTDADVRFRSVIDMSRYNFGRGEYKYFAYPLPEIVDTLRTYFYAGLAPIANDWERLLGKEPSWPESLQRLIERCHAESQQRPTPLMLNYGPGDYNCLHQDLYGPIHFPLQVRHIAQ